MKSKNQKMVFMTVLALMLAFALPALSEEYPSDNMQILREKMRADKKFFIAKTIKLTASEAKAFWPVYESYQSSLMILGDRLLKGIRSYAENYGNMSDKRSKSLRTEYLTIKMEELRLLESYLPKFEKRLPEKKVFRFFQLERTFQGELEAILGEVIPLIRYDGDDKQDGKK